MYLFYLFSFKGKDREYEQHLSIEQLEAGVKAGLYISGTLHVNRFRPHHVAYVKVGDALSTKVF